MPVTLIILDLSAKRLLFAIMYWSASAFDDGLPSMILGLSLKLMSGLSFLAMTG